MTLSMPARPARQFLLGRNPDHVRREKPCASGAFGRWGAPESLVLAAAVAAAALGLLGPRVALDTGCPPCTLLVHLSRSA